MCRQIFECDAGLQRLLEWGEKWNATIMTGSGSNCVIASESLVSDLRIVADNALISHENKHRMGAWPRRQDIATERIDAGWAVSATMKDGGPCPACDTKSSRRHGSYVRHLQDSAAQGAAEAST
jgi:hypothetical protein